MPAVPPGSLILVTGASGFIASHVAKTFLDEGYNVRGTVRSPSKGEYLVNLFKDTKGKFEYVIVEDISKEGAFDEAVKGVDGVAHTASPVTFAAERPEDLFEPSVKGTVNVLNSIKENNPNIGRIVYTSSSGTVNDPEMPCPVSYDETSWNIISEGVCERLGAKADGGHKYRASKVLAEKAFWKFFEDERPSFDGVTIHPVMTYGPIIHQCDSPKSLNDSIARRIWPFVSGQRTEKDLPEPGSSFVDVRDVALAHVRSMSTPEASGQRFLASSERYSGNDVCVILNKEFPYLENVPKGDDSPGARERINAVANFMDSAKSQRVLGIQYRPIEDVVRDTTESLVTRFGLKAN
ncbi:hypothetical protein I316_07329 [Kwoniella heveanensis BCC8398]|uniref:NAD-dependent epimerase/dehydratase domain-containing protein n=1 Tax=Kwoniella heveanensis BCC8398 TaxID=1296120 RepID=A0A1B9GJ81_9TREE|nr:hypothetical protein I316_07329 [Kwoniella heveanensis BCC8398]